MDRRCFLKLSLATTTIVPWACSGLIAPGPLSALALPRPMKAFAAENEMDVLHALFGTTEVQPSGMVEIVAPLMSAPDRGLAIEVMSSLANVETIAIVTENNDRPLNLVLRLDGADPYLKTRVVVEQTSRVTAYVWADKKLHSASASIKVSSGGYGMHGNAEAAANSRGSSAHVTKIRAKQQAGKVQVQTLVRHPMTPGQHTDPQTGQPVPADFIEQMTFAVNGQVVAEALLGPNVAANPLTGIMLPGGAPGDQVTVTWTDNRGEKGQANAVLG